MTSPFTQLAKISQIDPCSKHHKHHSTDGLHARQCLLYLHVKPSELSENWNAN